MPISRPTPRSRPQPHCPSCSAVLGNFARFCPRCHFTAGTCVQKFPFQAPRLERYLDAEGRLDEKQRRGLNRAIDRFERVFPQVRFFVCMTRLPEALDCREFGYWLFNACQPVDELDAQHRFFGILVVIDRANRTASITVGYGLDPFLGDHALFRLLEDVSVEFKCGKYRHGLRKLLRGLETQLKASTKALPPGESARERKRTPSLRQPSAAESPALAHGHP